MKPITTNTMTITMSVLTLPAVIPSSIATWASAGVASAVAVTSSISARVPSTRHL